MVTKVRVLDTSVLLSVGSRALYAFRGSEVVVPITVVRELEKKKSDPLNGFVAREVIRKIESLVAKYGTNISRGIAIAEGSTLRIEDNHVDRQVLPEPLRSNKETDNTILAVVANLSKHHPEKEYILITNDIAMRVTAIVTLGLQAEEFKAREMQQGNFMGLFHGTTPKQNVDYAYSKDKNVKIDLDMITWDQEPNALNYAAVITSVDGHSSALVKVQGKTCTPVNYNNRYVKPRSVEQKIALDYLKDESLDLVSLGGRAGTGKTLLALASGLEQTLGKRKYRKVVVFRPLLAVGNQNLGYLPGTEEEKMSPWAAAVYDALDALGEEDLKIVDEVESRGLLEVLPITHVRGRTLSNTFIIIDEAQNLESNVLLTILSRLGEGSKMVLCWDAAQKDNFYISRNDGIVALVDRLKSEDIFAHVTFTKSERSKVAEIASNILEETLR